MFIEKDFVCSKKKNTKNQLGFCNHDDFSLASNEPTYTWSGQLPPRNYKNPIYSNKIFLGGVPWDITEGNLFFLSSIFKYFL